MPLRKNREHLHRDCAQRLPTGKFDRQTLAPQLRKIGQHALGVIAVMAGSVTQVVPLADSAAAGSRTPCAAGSV
jgi:hypothetical protein